MSHGFLATGRDVTELFLRVFWSRLLGVGLAHAEHERGAPDHCAAARAPDPEVLDLAELALAAREQGRFPGAAAPVTEDRAA